MPRLLASVCTVCDLLHRLQLALRPSWRARRGVAVVALELAVSAAAAFVVQGAELLPPLPLHPRVTQVIEPDGPMAARTSPADLVAQLQAARAGRWSATAVLPNILVNDPTGQPVYTGNTQTEPSVAACGDTVVCGFTDSAGFFGYGTVTGFAISFDAGQTWYDAGSLPRVGGGSSEMVLGDPTVVTDGHGNWYCLSVYDIGNGWGDPGTGDLGLVLQRGRFLGTNLQWSLPWLVAGGGVGDALDCPHMAIDPERDRIYITYSNLSTSYAFGQIEMLTVGDAGTTLLHQCIVQPMQTEIDNYGSSVAVGPDGEVYCAWEGGMLDGLGQGPAEQRIARSQDGGATFAPSVVAGTVIESWLSGPPGFNQEQYFVESPSLAVDHSTGPHRGRVYLTWHHGVWRDFDGSPQTVSEASGSNDTPQTAQVLPSTASQWYLTGGFTSSDWVDWYRFSGVAGEHVRMWLQPNSAIRLGLHLWSGEGPGGALADTMLAGSARATADIVFFLFTLPRDGNYYMQISRSNFTTGSYSGYLRKSTVTSPGPAIDHRDIVVVSSPDGVSDWTPVPVRVNDDTGYADQAFPAVVVDGDGGVHVSWYDRRFDPRWHAGADFMLASSFDGGTSFTPNVRVTSETSFWQVPADMVPNFGDVVRPVADGKRVYLVWTDGRLGGPDVMTAPLRTDFTLRAPATVRASIGEPLGLALTVRNDGPFDGAAFAVQVHPHAAELSDTTLVVSALDGGDSATVHYDPLIGTWIRQYGYFDVEVTTTSNRSAHVDSHTVTVIGDRVDVQLSDVSVQRTDAGVELRWRCAEAASFDVERGARAAGPFVRVTPAPLEPQAAGGRYTYIDASAPATVACAYRLIGHAADGSTQVLGPWIAAPAAAAARRVKLLGAQPNPFNPTTTLRFELPSPARVSLRILDVRGRVVAELLRERGYDAGQRSVRWDAATGGKPVGSGVYVAELTALGARVTQRIVLLR